MELIGLRAIGRCRTTRWRLRRAHGRNEHRRSVGSNTGADVLRDRRPLARLAQRGCHIACRLESVARVLLQESRDDRCERGTRTRSRNRRYRIADVFERDRDGRLARVRQLAGDHLIDHDAKRIEIGGFIDLEALRLFGRNIVDAAHDHAGLRDAAGIFGDCAGNTKVRELHHIVFGDQDVGGLDVAVEDTLPMRVGKAACNLRGIVDRDGLRNRLVRSDLFRERFAVDELHHDIVFIAFASDVVHVDDVRMRELGRRLRFIIEALDEIVVGGILIAQYLDRNTATQKRIRAGVDDRHAAVAEATFDAVAVVKNAFVHGALPDDGFRCRAKATRRTFRAIGAAYVPPYPTFSTTMATATTGRSAGAKATNQA